MKIPKPIQAGIALWKIFYSVVGTILIFPILLFLGLINIIVDKFNEWKSKK